MCYDDGVKNFARLFGDKRFHPDGLLTSAESKHDVDTWPHVIAPDPFASDDCLDDFSPIHPFPLTPIEELNTMNTSDDEPSSGLNGRLRPRKSTVPSPHTTKTFRKSDSKTAQEKPKRTSTPSKVLGKPDDLANKSDFSPVPHFLCPYCDAKFAAKQTISKHVRRMHSSTSKQDALTRCLFCNHTEAEPNDIIRHMVDSHPNQYFACLDCHNRFPSTTELAEHKLNVCEKQKIPYRNKLRQKSFGRTKKSKTIKIDDKDFQNDAKAFPTGHGFNGVVISCEIKPSQVVDVNDIEDNIVTNLILPPSKALGNNSVLDKNAVILLDDIQWNKRIPSNFSFHNTDADQILSRLGVVHRSPRTGESTKRDWLRTLDDATQKFEKCFDTSFYSKVASNVQENLTKFLDGSFNFNPDPDSTIKTRKAKNSVVINTAEGFPILLAYEQYSRNTFDGYMPRAIAPKHKWKWDNLESDRIALSADQIKRDSHTNNCIITLVSSLDIWTQLCMRRKFEEKHTCLPLAKKTDKQTAIDNELKEILESREIPSSSSQVVKFKHKPAVQSEGLDFPASLGLTPSTPKYELPPAILSGEWVRPRCLVCCACGAPMTDPRSLSAHMATKHPNAQVQHYEVVGELLLNADILKHLYVPPNQMHNRTRPLRGFRECTKCKKSITLEDLHQHMLDCAGDTPTVRRKCRYRPFGVRRRRPRLPDNRIRKKMRKDMRNRQTSQKSHMRSRPKDRTEVGDAETIRKMLADLPAKRHRVLVNPINSVLRPRKKLDKQRNKLLMKRRISEDPKNRKLRAVKHTNYSEQSGSSTNDEHRKYSSAKSDDDKPLKRSVKRVPPKGTRENEAMKRKVALNRARRKLKSAEQDSTDNEGGPDLDVVIATNAVEHDDLSIENTPQRIAVNSGSYNTRENSNRGSNSSNNGSNNREQQPPGNIEHNGNSNNSQGPVQNTPLKHSIARLTADCETHDKSVQFHHMFLVQQECNNLNQHVPTGHQLLFENEAAVSRLDKPPLAGDHRGILDPYGLQKSKLNKPRKGLNDCIAMLKNKLVEPTPGLTSSQISVQCGSDDPLDAEPLGPSRLIEDKHIDTSKPAEIFSRHNMNLDMESVYERNYEYPSERHPVSMPYEMISRLPGFPSEDARLRRTLQNSPQQKTSRQSSRRRSARSVAEPIPQFIAPGKRQPQTTKRQSVRVSQRRYATRQIVVNINTDVNKDQLFEMPCPSKISPRQVSPRQISPRHLMINTESGKDQITQKHSPNKLSPVQVSPKQINVNVDINKTHSRRESISRQVSPREASQANDTFSTSQVIHKQISPKQGSHDHDILTSSKFMSKQVSPKQVSHALDIPHYSSRSPKQLSPKQFYDMQYTSRIAQMQVSPIQVSQASDLHLLSNLVPKQTLDIQTFSKLPYPNLLSSRRHSHSHALETYRLTQKQVSPKQISQSSNTTSSMLAPKSVSPRQMTYDTQAYSKLSASNLAAARSVSQPLDIQYLSNISPKQMSPRHTSPRQALNVNTELLLTRSIETPSPRFTSQSNLIDPKQSEDFRAQASSWSLSQAGQSSYPRRSPHSRSSSKSAKLRSPSLPREAPAHSLAQGPPLILLYGPPPLPPPPPPPPVASHSPEVMPHLQQSQPQQNWQTNVYHDLVRQNSSDVSNEHPTRKISVEVYTDSEYTRAVSDIPRAHASTIIEPLVSVPLDLSGKTPNVDNVNVSKHEPSFVANYEDYETLDLSKKTSGLKKGRRDVTDVVVDLRVKPPSQSTSLSLPELSNAPQNADVMRQEREDDSTPTDLSVRTKHALVHNATSNEQSYGIQDLSSQKPIQQLRDNVNEVLAIDETPTDLSGKTTSIPSYDDNVKYVMSKNESRSSLIVEVHNAQENTSTVLPIVDDVDNNAPADLSDKSRTNTLSYLSSDILKLTPVVANEIMEENIKVIPKETNSIGLDNNTLMQKIIYDPTLKLPLYKIRPATSNSSDIEEMTDDIRTQIDETLDEANMSTIPNIQVSIQEKPFNLTSTPLNTSNTIASSIPVFTLPSLVSSAHFSRYESTTPVYTLANACISVTKIDGPGVVPLTSSLLSIPSSTIASTTSVYTLAGTTIGLPVNYGSKSTIDSEILPPVTSMPSSVQVGCENASEIERQIKAVNKNKSGNQRLKEEAPNNIPGVEQDPETARKIAMLPKELVEILGTMPPGHRNQLLNVLPQYVSNTNTNTQEESAQHATPSTFNEVSVSPAITSPSTFIDNNVASKYESPINYQNAMATLSSDNRFKIASLSVSQLNDNFESDVKQHFSLSSLPSSLLCAVSKNSIDDIKPPIRDSNTIGDSKIETLSTSETNAKKLYNQTVIDLTEDDTGPSNTIIKATDEFLPTVVLSTLITQPIINLSTITKPKVTNEKTSMLRAVRIKTPSERHKSVSTEKQVQLSKSILEKESPVIEQDHDFLFNKTLAIQQSEVSSTQQQKKDAIKFTSQMSPVLTELNAETSEPTKLSHEISTEPNISRDENEDKTVTTKSVLVTSSISASQSVDMVVKESVAKVVSDGLQADMTPYAENNITGNHSIKSSVPVSESLGSENSVKPDETEQKHEDEDSEDDISLAVIVKQKQLDQQSNITKEEHVSVKKDKRERKKKHKIKMIKKSEKKPIDNVNDKDVIVETITASTITTDFIDSDSISNEDRRVKDLLPIAQDCTKTGIFSKEKEKHSKKKTRKTRRGKRLFTTSTTSAITDDDFQNQDLQEIIIDNNSVSSTCVKTHDKNEINETKLQIHKTIPEDIQVLNVEYSVLNVTVDHQKATDKISCDLLDDSDKTNTEYNKKKDKTSKKKEAKKFVQSSLANIEEKEVKSLHVESAILKETDMNDEYNKVVEPDSCSLIELSDTQDSILEDNLNTEESNFDSALESKNNKNNARSIKIKKVELASNCLETSEIQDQIVTPLRRSRRGKSLYVDNITSDTESSVTESEIVIEQKTPLTKKQLIFSKLLLDEENTNNKPQAHSTPEKINDEETPGKFANESLLTQSSIGISSNSSDIEVIKHISEKNKATKRRQSPQVKRKVKKIKSIESFQHTEDDSDTDNSICVEKHIVKVDVIPQAENSASQKSTIEIEKAQNVEVSDSSDMIAKYNETFNTDNIRSEVGINQENLRKLSSSAEKRKNPEYIESELIPKSKKCKLIIKDNKPETTTEATSIQDGVCTNPEVRTACYNKPVPAARRTRSKSAVVKSSATLLYDPYDIDLDDMIEKNEPIFIKKGKHSDTKTTSSSYLYDTPTSTKNTTSKAQKKASVITEYKTSKSQKKKTIVSEKATMLNRDYDETLSEDDFIEEDERGNISDSDDSSKSDIPLQKYVEEKEKRVSVMDHDKDLDDDTDYEQEEFSGDKSNSNDSKSSRKTLAVCNSVEGTAAQSETEEQLRSEQFMESFGFFSERKPRKSNLLASKKISETFHIIANESDDVYFGYKDRTTKKLQNENKKAAEAEGNSSKTTQSSNKKVTKRGRKKKSSAKPVPCYCNICKKEFRRPDNYLRHQMSLIHISKLSEVELKIKTIPIHEEPNYLIAYKQYLDRLKILTDKLAKKKKNSKGSTKIKLPTVEEILADLNKTIREQQRGELSRDEALFLDCCELLKESHINEKPNPDAVTSHELHINEKDILDDTKSDGDVDSITAKTILESEEVRNLENDLISGLKEAANASLNSKMNYRHVTRVESPQELAENLPSSNTRLYDRVDEFTVVEKPHVAEKSKKEQREIHVEEKEFVYKEKMYPDIIEDIDMFEDKFDKIKRKCRSQAAAAKQSQVVVEPNESHKSRRKSDKKKGKKSKKNHKNSHVPTKGALKGFDGIKVSIPTSDINMSAIVPPIEVSVKKKKKKGTSKKKRDKKDSESSRYDSDHRGKESTSQKKVDVYEFMDNEDAELFEFRPSTLMERFKNILSKDMPSTSKFNPGTDDFDNSSESGSDGDDFVYMSDDYVCSDDETENSILSCELSAGKYVNEPKKSSSPMKRKDAVEKNAVMGKIFKHNAVRTEKKTTKAKEPAKPKANLDQLFDSLLEDEPSSSTIKSDSPRKEQPDSPKDYHNLPASKYEPSSSTFESISTSRDSIDREFALPQKVGTHKYDNYSTTSKKPQRPSLQAEEFIFNTKKYDSPDEDYGPSTTKRFGSTSLDIDYGPSTSKKYDMKSPTKEDRISSSPKIYDSSTSNKTDMVSSKGNDYGSSKYGTSMRREEGSFNRRYSLDKSPTRKTDEGISTSYDYNADVFEQSSYDDTGVARQRARRKCTVGKQNVLAESWSSESEPERGPPRPTSAESVLSTGGRKKKGKKKEGHPIGGRRGNRQMSFRKQDVESRVSSSNRNTSTSGAGGSGSESSGRYEDYRASGGKTSVSTGVQVSLGPPAYPGPSGVKPRTVRPAPYAWTNEGDDEQEHLQQHGWIVGDSHKKLVTMLAHAKGRKRNSDDKRHLVE